MSGLFYNYMQKLISQIPELSLFLARTPKAHHEDAIKHLIRLGLQTTRTYAFKENDQNSSNAFKKQLDSIKNNIETLNFMVRQQCHHHCLCYQANHDTNIPNAAFQREHSFNDQNTFGKNAGNITRPTPDKNPELPIKNNDLIIKKPCQAKENAPSANPFAKKASVARHHLDDSGVRQALQFPPETFIETETRIKRRSQDYKKHIYQDQINREQLKRIKQEKGESLDKSRRDRTVSDYTKTTSKIKPLLDKDRIRFMQRQRQYEFNEGFNKYEYSDQSQMEESSLREEPQKARDQQTFPRFPDETAYNPHYQSSFKGSHQASSNNKTSSKKQFNLSKKELSSRQERSLVAQGLGHEKSKSGSKGEVRSYQHQQEISRGAIGNIDYEQDEDVVSNSSSFSQFSINGSRQKEVGKISRRSHND